MGQAALDARLQNGVGPRVPQGRSVLSQQVGELFTDLSVAQMEQRDRGREGVGERGREMNHHWRQQSLCMLPARLHKPPDQGGCCPRAQTRSLASPSPLHILPPNSHASLARTNLFPSPCTHSMPRPQPTHRQIAGKQMHTHLPPTPTDPHSTGPHKHTSLPSSVLWSR